MLNKLEFIHVYGIRSGRGCLNPETPLHPFHIPIHAISLITPVDDETICIELNNSTAIITNGVPEDYCEFLKEYYNSED